MEKLEQAPDAMIDCPYCAEPVRLRSKKCRHCGEIIDPQMRDMEYLKSRRDSPNVFMNAGGGGAAASSSSGDASALLRRFPHWLHLIISLFTAGMWIPVWIILYLFRNRRYYI